MNFSRSFIFIFMFYINISAMDIHAQEGCENFNLFETHSQLNDVPIMNQGELHTCYAHTLASLYNMTQVKDQYQDLNQLINPYNIAFTHKDKNLHWAPYQIGLSLMGWAWKDITKKGICSQEYVGKKLNDFKQGVDYSDDQFFYLLELAFKDKFFLTQNPSFSLFQIKVTKLLKKIKEEEKKLYLKKGKVNFFEKNWNKEEVSKILFYTLKKINTYHRKISKPRLFFFQFIKQHIFNCKKSEQIQIKDQDMLVRTSRWFDKNIRLETIINNNLKNNNPVAIGYCSKLTYGQNYLNDTKRLKILPRFAKAIMTDKKCGMHYSIIAGSKNNVKKNQCEILIRNSYSTNWWANKDATCFCEEKKSDGSFGKRDCYRKEFTESFQGKPHAKNLKILGCWFERDRLIKNTWDLNYFKQVN